MDSELDVPTGIVIAMLEHPPVDWGWSFLWLLNDISEKRGQVSGGLPAEELLAREAQKVVAEKLNRESGCPMTRCAAAMFMHKVDWSAIGAHYAAQSAEPRTSTSKLFGPSHPLIHAYEDLTEILYPKPKLRG